MAKKYIIHDGDDDYIVSELEENEDIDVDQTPVETSGVALTDEEIAALKGLAAVAPKLMALVNTTEEEPEEIEEIEETEDACKDKDEVEEKEEVIETRDSKKSFGSIERKRKTNVDDSLVDEISEAWAKRYGGNK